MECTGSSITGNGSYRDIVGHYDHASSTCPANIYSRRMLIGNHLSRVAFMVFAAYVQPGSNDCEEIVRSSCLRIWRERRTQKSATIVSIYDLSVPQCSCNVNGKRRVSLSGGCFFRKNNGKSWATVANAYPLRMANACAMVIRKLFAN